MSGSRTHVAHFQNQVLRQLLLNSQAPLLNARGLQVRIHSKHRGLNDGLGGVTEDLIYDGEFASANELRRAWGIARKIKPGIGIHRRIENSGAAANNQLAVS